MLSLWSTLSSIASFILMFWLYAFDKAGKLNNRTSFVILGVAALLASLPVVFVVSEKVPDDWRWWSRLATVAILCLVYWAAAIWLSNAIVTPENAERHVKEWADYLQRPIEKLQPEPDEYFRWRVTTVAEYRVGVRRTKNRDLDLNFITIRIFTPEQQSVLDALSPEEMRSLGVELKAEAARADVHFEAEIPLRRFAVMRSVRIRPDLNATDFGDALNQIDRGVLVLSNVLIDGLKRRGASVVDLR